MTPEAGLAITPSVHLVQPLGRGGMGSVWLAEHRSLRSTVVVKFMAPTLAEDAQAVARFVQEATVAAQVRSPHVVTMLEHGMYDGLPYIVMEHLSGEDLAVRLRRGPLPPHTVVAVVEQLALALARVHERGILHRDIKPANVFLCEGTGHAVFVKLLDFGVAKSSELSLADASTRTGTLVGTPFYMSPEHLAGKKGLDARSDLWAVGILVFEALTGTRPFRADSIGELVLLVHSSTPPRITALAPSLPPAIDTWFARACAREPADRFASAGELASALGAALAGVAPAPVSRASPPETAATLADAPWTATEGAISVDTPPRRPARGGRIAIAGLAALGLLVPGGYLAARRLAPPAAAVASPVAPVAPSAVVVASPQAETPSAAPRVEAPPSARPASSTRSKKRPRPAPSASARRAQFEDIE